MTKDIQPIGIFDSGIGGLTVANAILKHLPKESIIYFGDTAHLPYGEKSADAIRYYTLRIGKFLLDQGCKMIVVACNSAASTAYKDLLAFFEGQVFFASVVDPLVEAVVQRKYKKVGVIATKATIASGVYQQKINEANPNIEVISMATPLLVPMIEEGFHNNDISEAVISNYLSQAQFDGIDALLLACTHYPLIKENIKAHFDYKVDVLDSTDVVTQQVQEVLKREGLLSNAETASQHFYVSDFTPSFEETTKVFFGRPAHLEQIPLWED